MTVKKLLGEIMTAKGFVTREQVERALQKQKTLFGEKRLPEQLERSTLISKARAATNRGPLLGQILMDMEFATLGQLNEALKEQEQMLALYKSLNSETVGAVLEIGSIVNSTLNLAEVLALIMKHLNRVTDSDASSLMLLDQQTGELVLSVATGPKAVALTDIRIPPGRGIAGWVAQHGQTALVSNAQDDPRFYPEIDKKNGFETKSILCVPLKAKTALIGVLEVINKADGPSFTDEDAVLMSIFSCQAAMAIENARLYVELDERMEKEIEIQKKLAETEKFLALGQLASGLAHDFNNLLMSIQGNISLMLLDVDSIHKHFERLKNIEESVKEGSELTRQLLDLTKGGAYTPKSTDLNALIEKSFRMFGSTKKEIGIHKKFQQNIWTAHVDQNQINQVLLNLYVNAWHAMPGGGDLYLRTENVTLNKRSLMPSGLNSGRYVKISVTDAGVGMDKRTLKRIFDPFFTTKKMGRGTGLGLASAYGIIRNHGGAITAESEKGVGSTFVIYLPASKKAIPNEKEVSEKMLNGNETILLVDDEDMIIDVGQDMLATLGYKTLTARNGKHAMEVLKKNRDDISLVVLDMIMPEMGGGETYDKMKEMDPDIKVLLASGYSIDGQATEILKRGCNGFIQKPFSVTDLSQKLRQILE